MRIPSLVTALFLVLLPVVASAQASTCTVQPIGNTLTSVIGDATYVSGRAQYDCTGGIRILSDSAVSAFGRRLLIGNVYFADSLKTLRSQYVQYEGRIGYIVTDGPTEVTDRKTGSILTAPYGLTYQKANQDNPQPRIEVTRGRPHLRIMEEPQPGQTPDTTDIDADRLEIIGEKVFRGWGRVVIKRGPLHATGNQTVVDDSLGIMDLWGIAHIDGDRYDVQGDSIHADIEGELFRNVRVFRNARIERDDLLVEGARLYIAFDSGAVNRLIALGGHAQPGAPAAQAKATRPDFTLTADSIDALAPGQALEQVIAVGHALGTRQPDSLDLKLPELIQKDWLKGDTIMAYFVELHDSVKALKAQSDTAGLERVLDRLTAIGSSAEPATAAYRVRAEGDTTHQVEVGYVTALRITAIFRNDAVHDLDAQGQIRGIYLQPIRRTTPGAALPVTLPPAQPVRGNQNGGRRGR
jgi:hypothetical protein